MCDAMARTVDEAEQAIKLSSVGIKDKTWGIDAVDSGEGMLGQEGTKGDGQYGQRRIDISSG
jgi:hypothetical protein